MSTLAAQPIVRQCYEKATLYLADLWGYDRIEAKNVTWSVERYARHGSAARVEYTPRGKRKRETAMITTIPLVILEGWDHPDPPNKYGPTQQRSYGVSRTTRRAGGDPEWDYEFRAFLNGYVAGSQAQVILDL